MGGHGGRKYNPRCSGNNKPPVSPRVVEPDLSHRFTVPSVPTLSHSPPSSPFPLCLSVILTTSSPPSLLFSPSSCIGEGVYKTPKKHPNGDSRERHWNRKERREVRDPRLTRWVTEHLFSTSITNVFRSVRQHVYGCVFGTGYPGPPLPSGYEGPHHPPRP